MIVNRKNEKENLIKNLEAHDIPSHERDYIIAVVDLLDTYMQVPDREKATIGNQINKMLDLCRRIHQGKTNIPEIDEIRQRRLNNARAQIGSFADQMSMESLPYVNNYIQDISSFGGLFAYVSKTYTSEIQTPYEKDPDPLTKVRDAKPLAHVTMDLLEDLKEEDLSPQNAKYISNVVKYLNKQMEVPYGTPADVSDRLHQMYGLAKKIDTDKTGVPQIDTYVSIERIRRIFQHIPLKGRNTIILPYMHNYIAAISPYGGLFASAQDQINKENKRNKPHRKDIDFDFD